MLYPGVGCFWEWKAAFLWNAANKRKEGGILLRSLGLRDNPEPKRAGAADGHGQTVQRFAVDQHAVSFCKVVLCNNVIKRKNRAKDGPEDEERAQSRYAGVHSDMHEAGCENAQGKAGEEGRDHFSADVVDRDGEADIDHC